jgi:aminotransferase
MMRELLAKRLAPKEGIDHRRVMIERARAMEDVISLGRGDPDLGTPDHIVAAAKRALDEGKTGYSPWPGYPELRKAIADKLREDNAITARPEEVLVTVGAEEAVFLTIMALLNPGEEILVPEPRYTPYDMAVEMAGGTIVSVPTDLNSRFQLDPDRVEERITPQTKALLVITPNNPTGQVLDKKTMNALSDLAEKHDLAVISDELYEKIVYEGVTNPSLASLPGMTDRTVTINGFSKTYCMTGWRVGYLHGPEELVKAMIPLKYTLTISAPSMCQMGALAALTGPQECVEEFRRIYEKRRKVVLDSLRSMGLAHGPARGAFYVYARVAGISASSFAFCKELLEEEKVLVFPGTAFGPGGEGFIRISLLAATEKIAEAMRRIERFVSTRSMG